MKVNYQALIIDFDCFQGIDTLKLQAFKNKGYNIGLLAKCERTTLYQELSEENRALFDAVLTQSETKNIKPNPMALIKMMKLLKSNGKNTLMIGNCSAAQVMSERVRVDFMNSKDWAKIA